MVASYSEGGSGCSPMCYGEVDSQLNRFVELFTTFRASEFLSYELVNCS
jgi:hypothetical protein